MPVKRHAGDKGLCDILAGRIVRSRGVCEHPDCDNENVVWAHIIGRGSSGTRCLEDNAWALCPTHHALVDSWWDEKQNLVEATIGIERWVELKRIAGEHKFRPITSAVFWAEEKARLQARCRELGLSDKRAA
jgi:hypothetical protein